MSRWSGARKWKCFLGCRLSEGKVGQAASDVPSRATGLGAVLLAPGLPAKCARGGRALDAAPVLPTGSGRIQRPQPQPSLRLPAARCPRAQLGRENGPVSVCTKEMKAQRCDQTGNGPVVSEGRKKPPAQAPLLPQPLQPGASPGVGFAQQLQRG